MKLDLARRAVLAAAIAPLFTAAAFGQVRANQNGQAVDANNRVGSGGYNQGVNNGPGVTSNQIFYGNTTGGVAFTGRVNERDPGAFTGPIPGFGFDRFIRGSAAAPDPYQPASNLNTPTPFYGASRGAPPPIGSIRNGYNGSYLGTDFNQPGNTALSSDYSTGYLDLTQRLGESQPIGSRLGLLGNQESETYLQGPLEAQNRAALFTGSPLYGVRTLTSGFDESQAPDASSGPLFPRGLDRYPTSQVQRLRAEMQGTTTQQNTSRVKTGNQQNSDDQSQDIGHTLEQPDNRTLNSRLNHAVGDPNLANGLNIEPGTGRQSGLLPPQQQSDQYNELRQRLQKYQNPQIAQLEANHASELAREHASKLNTDNGLPTSQPADPRAANAMVRFQPPQPLMLKSLAAGMRVNGLRTLLASAETLMRHDKFQSAIEKYNTAEQVAPNNALIPLGRANAELGAGYYQQASADLHKVFLSDQALLMGQFDLNSMLSPERARFVTKELEDLAQSDPKQEMPVFLLAYISYNTGKEADAAKYLDQAQQRSGGRDQLLKLLQTEWKLPKSEEKPENLDSNK